LASRRLKEGQTRAIGADNADLSIFTGVCSRGTKPSEKRAVEAIPGTVIIDAVSPPRLEFITADLPARNARCDTLMRRPAIGSRSGGQCNINEI
jgi:hypothetical protein